MTELRAKFSARPREMRTRAALTLAATIAAAVALAANQRATFHARRDVVRVDVLVTDHGRPVRSLTRDDFLVLEDGVPQDADLSTEPLPINAILAVDTSNSVAGARLDQLRDAGRSVLTALRAGDRTALIAFNSTLDLGTPLTTQFSDVASALDRLHAGGGTAVVDAAYAGLVLGDTDAGHTLLLILSDGRETSSWLTASSVLDAAARTAVVVDALCTKPSGLAVRVPGPTMTEAMRRSARANAELAYGEPVGDGSQSSCAILTVATGGSLVEIDPGVKLDNQLTAMLDEFRLRYMLSYSPKAAW